MMKRRSNIDATDRVSELPEPILQYIMSFLLFKDVARICTISKIWNNACNSLSYLNFGKDFFHRPPEDIPKLLNVVHQTLQNRQKQKISVEKFWLEVCYSEWTQPVYNWIGALVVCNIEVLNLKVGRLNNRRCMLPVEIFNAKTLNVLSLEGFYIKFPSNGIIKLSALREFNLRDSYVNEHFIQVLCTTCSNLEVLYLLNFEGLASLQVSETLTKLKRVSLLYYHPGQIQLVDIRATNLENLEICRFDFLEDHLKVVKITACKALTNLHLMGVAMTEKQFQEIFFCLQNLKKFDLFYCKTLKTLKISSVQLKQLHVQFCNNVIAVELDTPNLISFSYICASLPALKLKASVLLEANIFVDDSELTPNSDWYSKLMKFLDNFNHSMAIKLACRNDKALVIPKDIRENLLPPLYDTNFVQVNLEWRLINYSVVDFLESMFWISRKLDTLSYCDPDIKTLKFIYKDGLHEVEKKPCCTYQPWECWRHKLKKVEIHNIECVVKKQELINYFFTSTDISEIIEVPPIEFKYPLQVMCF